MGSTESIKNFEKYELSVGGQAITVNSDQKKEKLELIEKIANQKIDGFLKKNFSFQKSLIAALLQSCEELVDLKLDAKEQLDDIEELTARILEKFEDSLKEFPE